MIKDTIENTGDREEPFEILYHMNMGYPLLDEDSIIDIPSSEVRARNEHAKEDIANWMHMEKPTAGYEERCYYHFFLNDKGFASITQPKLGIKLAISYNAKALYWLTKFTAEISLTSIKRDAHGFGKEICRLWRPESGATH